MAWPSLPSHRGIGNGSATPAHRPTATRDAPASLIRAEVAARGGAHQPAAGAVRRPVVLRVLAVGRRTLVKKDGARRVAAGGRGRYAVCAARWRRWSTGGEVVRSVRSSHQHRANTKAMSTPDPAWRPLRARDSSSAVRRQHARRGCGARPERLAAAAGRCASCQRARSGQKHHSADHTQSGECRCHRDTGVAAVIDPPRPRSSTNEIATETCDASAVLVIPSHGPP